MLSSPSLIPNLLAAGLYIAAAIYHSMRLAQGTRADKRLLGLLGTIAVIAQAGALLEPRKLASSRRCPLATLWT